MASWRRAGATDEHVRASLGEALYYLAGCHARLGGIAGAAGSGLPASEGPAELDRAMALLRRAAENGYGNVSEMRRDPDLDPLRGRPDFQAMMADLAFPAQPFAIDGELGGGTGNGPMISLRPSLITEHHSVSSLKDLAREASPCSRYLRPARDEDTAARGQTDLEVLWKNF